MKVPFLVREAPRGALALVLALGSAACSGGDDGGGGGAGGGGAGGGSSCSLGFLGDAAMPVEMKVTARGADKISKELTPGGEAAMILPPQGGRVLFVGVRATNIGACGVELTGTLRDKATNQIRVDGRTTNLKPTGDGWGASVDSDISTFSNIPVCPNQWASTDMFGQTFELEVTLVDKEGRTASQKLDVMPSCAEAENQAECLCQCKQGYKLGQTCN